MNAVIKSIFLLFFISIMFSCMAQKRDDGLAFLSRDFYLSFNFENAAPNSELKYRMYDILADKFDSVYDIKRDEYVYARIDSIEPIEILEAELSEIHFWTIQDRKNLFEYFRIDSLNSAHHLDSIGWKLQRDYYNYHNNFYIIEKKGEKYYKIKVFRRERLIGHSN